MEAAIKISVEDRIVILEINRPKSLNALNSDVMTGLNQWFSEGYKDHKGLYGIIITGSGTKAFVAGADIKKLSEVETTDSDISKYGHETFNLIENFHLPVIAAVNGFALGGGCELAMSCHIRIASDNAKFGQPEVNLGLIPGYGGTQRLIQLVGKGRAMELLLTADIIDATTAMNYGLANKVVPQEELMETCKTMLIKIGNKGPNAISKSIEMVNAFYDKKTEAFKKEYELFAEILVTEECKEGISAFIEKRKPTFKR